MAQAQMKTPGVYLVEKNAFPNSVVEVATAVPAFIGYTKKAENGGKSLLNKPFRISSFSEYLQYFGGAPSYKFKLDISGGLASGKPGGLAGEFSDAINAINATIDAVENAKDTSDYKEDDDAAKLVATTAAATADKAMTDATTYIDTLFDEATKANADAIAAVATANDNVKTAKAKSDAANDLEEQNKSTDEDDKADLASNAADKATAYSIASDSAKKAAILVTQTADLLSAVTNIQNDAKQTATVIKEAQANTDVNKAGILWTKALRNTTNTLKAVKDAENKAGITAPQGTAKSSSGLIINNSNYMVSRSGNVYRMYDAMRFFFQNGGGACYVVSVGDYTDAIQKDDLVGETGLLTLEKEQEPTMVLCPDALSLDKINCYNVYTSILDHCGNKMRSRVGIFDVYEGYKAPLEVVNDFRNYIGANFLDFGAAYYPWLKTGVVQDSEISFQNLHDDSLATLTQIILDEHKIDKAPAENSKEFKIYEYAKLLPKYVDGYVVKTEDVPVPDDLHKTLVMQSPAYNTILKEIQNQLNLMPVAPAMAGIYSMVDNTRGVWKAPANVSVNNTVSPSVNITFDDQADLNMPLNGKAINAIRSFVGEGSLVWGARTLDGNSQDWRYINVRRTMIMLEQSVITAAKAYVFEPNDANTWVTVKSMIDNFLYQQWKKGALVGSKSTDAYSVLIGLGNTMTGDDILNGIMRITVLVAISRPAEFIEITFQQQMQKS